MGPNSAVFTPVFFVSIFINQSCSVRPRWILHQGILVFILFVLYFYKKNGKPETRRDTTLYICKSMYIWSLSDSHRLHTSSLRSFPFANAWFEDSEHVSCSFLPCNHCWQISYFSKWSQTSIVFPPSPPGIETELPTKQQVMRSNI